MKNPVMIAKDFGPFLIGRGIGKEIRESHFKGEPSEWPSLDFSGVVQVTESALDEIFGTLARSKGCGPVEKIEILGASRHIKEALEFVFSLIKSPPSSLTSEQISKVLGRKTTTTSPRKKRRKAVL